MATNKDYKRLRADIGATEASLPDGEAADIFEEAGELYTDTPSIKASTRVIAIQRLFASSAKMTTYRQNNTQENLSDVIKNLKMLLDYWTGLLDGATNDAIVADGGGVRLGGVRIRPARIQEYPDA